MDRKLVEGIIRVRKIISPYTFLPTILLRVTPSAKRNTYSIATHYYIYTQGSVLRPQPCAGETQLLQSCRCLWAAIYCGLFAPMGHVWLVHSGWYAPMGHVWLAHCGWYAPLATL